VQVLRSSHCALTVAIASAGSGRRRTPEDDVAVATLVQLLVDRGADVNAFGGEDHDLGSWGSMETITGKTPLCEAIEQRSVVALKILLAAGADPNQKSSRGLPEEFLRGTGLGQNRSIKLPVLGESVDAQICEILAAAREGRLPDTSDQMHNATAHEIPQLARAMAHGFAVKYQNMRKRFPRHSADVLIEALVLNDGHGDKAISWVLDNDPVLVLTLDVAARDEDTCNVDCIGMNGTKRISLVMKKGTTLENLHCTIAEQLALPSHQLRLLLPNGRLDEPSSTTLAAAFFARLASPQCVNQARSRHDRARRAHHPACGASCALAVPQRVAQPLATEHCIISL